MKYFFSRLSSFKHAFRGWVHVFRTQPNARIHLIATIIAVLLGAFLEIAPQEWAIMALVIGFVWMMEFVNTAIETVVDLASPQFHHLAKISKDVSAGAVLIAAISAIVVGLLILTPALINKISP